VKAGWQKRQLGELAELRGRIGWRGLTAKEYTKTGPMFLSVHSLNYGDYVDFRDAFHVSEARYDESPEIILHQNDVLICKDGAGIGKVGIVGTLPDRATINSSLLLIRSKASILPKFLYRCLSSPYFQSIVNSRLNGATTPHLYQRDITEFPIVLPPLPEQRRIVGILDEAFEGIVTAKANVEKNLQNARALFESYLQSVFTQRGESWVETVLSEVCGLQNGFAFKSGTFRESGQPILRISNIQDERVDTEKLVFFDPKDYRENLDRYRIVEGDLLIAMSGATTGKLGFNTEKTVFYLNQRVGKFEPGKRLNKAFLFYFLSTRVKENLRISAGAAQPNLSTEQIKGLVLPLPPVATQEHVVSALNSLSQETDRLASIYQQKQAALDELKKSLLHQAFSGEL
jgi:type I restriction enzyme S subunit